LAELDLERLPAHQKKVDSDWFAIFNPEVQRVLDVDLVHTLQHESVVCCVRFSHDGKYVATGCNRSAQIFDVISGQKICILQDESVDSVGDLYIRSVCFSPDGRYLATGAEDKLIRVWDIASRTIRNTFSGHEQDIYSLDFARDGRTIASGSGDRTVRLWDINEGQNILTLSIEDGVTTVAISPDTKLVAAGSLDKSVRVWDASSGYLVERLEGPDGHKDSVYSVAFAPNGKDLVSGSLDKTIKMWELVAPRGGHPNNAPKGGRCIRTFEGHKVCATTTSSKMLHLTLFRILFFLLLLLLMETGFFPDLKTVVSNSGTLEPVIHSLCCKVTRIASFQLHQVQAAARSLPVVEI
jgi:glucose repression regulatory protein TUP1